MPKKQTAWTRAFNEKAYDRISVTIPKGRKNDVEAFAQSHGKTVNGLINSLLQSEIGLSEIEWKAKPDQDEEEL